ncbi:MAG: DUF5606 domain-containing protein [Bacteroidales bacterium]|jgi:hypothetical protein|nr:DUF5606 domain-containing protein [Bacteroidales bacterium]
MNLKDLLAISGESGLFRFVAQGRNAIIVEHLDTGKRQTASSTARVSSLEDISIFTDSEEIKLSLVFDRIWDKERGGTAPDPKKASPDILDSYFSEVVPEYDKERVYPSDIKKVLMWYNTLHRLNLLVKEEESAEKDPEQETHRPETKAETPPEPKRPVKVPEKKKTVKKATVTPAKKRMTTAPRKQG